MTKDEIIPEFIELLSDDQAAVRESALISLMDIIDILDKGKTKIVPQK